MINFQWEPSYEDVKLIWIILSYMNLIYAYVNDYKSKSCLKSVCFNVVAIVSVWNGWCRFSYCRSQQNNHHKQRITTTHRQQSHVWTIYINKYMNDEFDWNASRSPNNESLALIDHYWIQCTQYTLVFNFSVVALL